MEKVADDNVVGEVRGRLDQHVRDAWERSELVGRATAQPPRAAGWARRRHSIGNFLYIKLELCNFLAKYFYIIRIVRVPKILWFR